MLSLKSEEGDEFDSRLLRMGRSLDWPELLAEYRTVILSEAGAGKTEEIRHSTISLRKAGKAAFFLRLEHVAEDFEIAFEEGTFEEFERWLVSSEEGWLFLDSVDETRLRAPKDFERAVRRIGARLSNALQRTHIVITSREWAWRPVTDLKLCEKHFPYVAPTLSEENGKKTHSPESEASCFRIVALDDLREAQIETFARARGVENSKLLIAAIERAEAWSMVARPDDLSEVIEFWKKYGRIGNRLDLMQSSVARRLLERDQNRAEGYPLSSADAQLGVRLVAAVATMSKESMT